MKGKFNVIFWFVLILLVIGISPYVRATETEQNPPNGRERPGPKPSSIVDKLMEKRPPPLTGSGTQAKANAKAFIDWASASTKAQSESVRRAVTEARNNKDILTAFCNELFQSQRFDHSRSLIILSLIGEARFPIGKECLVKFIKQPLPEKGTIVDGEILEQTALATLQAKAIDGLAYLRTKEADEFVLTTVAKHPSRIVRSEAIAAYLWNHKNSETARVTLEKYVPPMERIYIDRVVKLEGEGRETFNRKLEGYMKKHPEVNPPAPAKKPLDKKHVHEQPPTF